MEKISFVIPCHNEEDVIERCLRHVVFQREFEELAHEVLVINDGSKDRSPEIVREFAKKHPRVELVSNPTNMGLSKSVNIGFVLAKGEFVFILHADCILEDKDYMKYLLKIVTEDPQVAIVTSRYVMKNLEGTPFRNRLFLLLNFVAAGWGVWDCELKEEHSSIEIGFTEFKCDLVRKSTFMALGGFAERLFVCAEDQYMCADIRKAGYRILMNFDKAYAMDFGSHQDRISKVMSKQVTYGATNIHVFWKKKELAIGNMGFWHRNRMIRTINRVIQVILPTFLIFLCLACVLFNRAYILIGGAIILACGRVLFYYLPNRKYLFSIYEIFLLGFWGIVADMLYFYGTVKGTLLSFLNRTIK